MSSIFEGISQLQSYQSIAHDGVFNNTGFTVDVNERAIIEAGFNGAIGSLPIVVTIAKWTVTNNVQTFQALNTITCHRVAPGVWTGGGPAPTVGVGEADVFVAAAALGQPIFDSANNVIATPAQINGRGVIFALLRGAAP